MLVAALLVVALAGCHASHRVLEPYGKTYYVEGAGGWGYGRSGVREGLRRAGYRGDCEVFNWSPTRIPLLDQIDPLGFNKLQASALAGRIKSYKQKFPDRQVNIIALSAGTGVAIWALEGLRGEIKVNNVFLVGSSLASHYDMQRALSSVAGQVYVYYSPYDLVLPLVTVLGTVDHRLGARAAGLVGLQTRESYKGKVINIGWDKKWERLGWKGGHTDCVGRPFVQYEIARKLVQEPKPGPAQTETEASTTQGVRLEASGAGKNARRARSLAPEAHSQ